jgi:predicted DNA-binding transcriptional regulator YafY
MPVIKSRVRNKVKHSQERIELLDRIIFSSFGKIKSRQELLHKVNDNLFPLTEISIDTLDKDLKYLKDLVFDDEEITIDFSKDKGYVYSNENYRYFKNGVDDKDKHLLSLAGSLFNVFKGTPLQKKFSHLVDKLMAESLTSDTVGGLQDKDYVYFENTLTTEGIVWISSILECIYERKSILMHYKGFGKSLKIKDVCPYLLKQYEGRWYLIAFDYDCTRQDKISVFSLDCIQKMTLSVKPYFLDNHFDPKKYFKYSIGIWHIHNAEPIKVELEFTGFIEMIQTNPLHHSQVAELYDNGNKLRVKIEVYDTPELSKLILGFGAFVKVCQPLSLAQKVKQDAAKILDLYSAL